MEELELKGLKQLARRHIEGYLAHLDREEYADSTRRRKLSVIKSFCAWLAQSRTIAADPAADIVPPRRQWKPRRVLTQDEYRRLVAVVGEPRDLALLQLLLQAGIRLAETHRLNLADVTLLETVDEQCVGQLRILGRPKESQTVYLNATACQTLAAWLR